MSPWLLGGIAMVIAGVLAQVLIPRIAERRIRRRLVEHGGEAFVAIASLPALRLLWHSGDRITVEGRQLTIGMSAEGRGLSALDGFREVEILFAEFTTGPFEVARLQLRRYGPGPYVMAADAHTNGASLLEFLGELGIGGGGVVGLLARQAPLGARSFPVGLEVELASVDGILQVTSGGGTIGGYPAGRIATVIAAAVARRLEISH